MLKKKKSGKPVRKGANIQYVCLIFPPRTCPAVKIPSNSHENDCHTVGPVTGQVVLCSMFQTLATVVTLDIKTRNL